MVESVKKARRQTVFLPLLGGEGRGEGERDFLGCRNPAIPPKTAKNQNPLTPALFPSDGERDGVRGAFHHIRFVSFCKPAPARLNDRKNCIVSAPFLHHFFISLWCSFVPPTNARASARRIRVPRSAFRVGPSCDLKFRAMVCSHCRAHPDSTTRFLRKSRRQGSAAQSSGNGRQRDAIERQRHAPIFQRNNLTEFRAAPVRCRPGHRLVESCRARLFREENRGPI